MKALLSEIRADIAAVHTDEFFVTGGAKPHDERAPLLVSREILPLSFSAFVSEFGGLRAFHDPADGGRYRIVIWGQLYLLRNARSGGAFAQLGSHRECEIGFRLLPNGTLADEAVIALDFNGVERTAAPDFESWLAKAWRREMKAVGRRRWEEIVAGPAPFTAAELEVIQARDQYRIQILASSEPGCIEFFVENNSRLQLQFITAGFRLSDKEIIALRIEVASIAPGRSGRIKQRFPDSDVRPDRLCRFPIEPTPANRARFWELCPPVNRRFRALITDTAQPDPQ